MYDVLHVKFKHSSTIGDVNVLGATLERTGTLGALSIVMTPIVGVALGDVLDTRVLILGITLGLVLCASLGTFIR